MEKWQIMQDSGHDRLLASSAGTPGRVPTAPPFGRVSNLFLGMAAAVCMVVLVDNLSFKPMTGVSIKGADYLFLGLAGAFLIIAVLRRDLGRRLAVSVVAVLLVLAVIEAGLGVWSLTRPRRSPWYVWPPNYSHLMKPGSLPGVAPECRFTTNSLGIRGPEFRETDTYRILCIGGSTAECTYLDDTKTWPAQLMRVLREGDPGVWVGNVGRSGTTAPQHVLLLRELPEARMVDCWVVLCGINDFGQQLSGQYAEMTAKAFSLLFKYRRPGLGGRWQRPLQRNLYTFALLDGVRKRLEVALKGAEAAVYQDDRASWVREAQEKRQRGAKVALDVKPEWIEEYQTHLMTIVALARQQGKRLIFMTQPTIWAAQMDEKTDGLTLGGQLADGRYVENSSRFRGMELYNQAMRQMAAREGIELVDLAAQLPKTTETFYDNCHFNENGARMVAAALAEQVKTRKLEAGVRK
jgi:lysophospholipase L1-like esterase